MKDKASKADVALSGVLDAFVHQKNVLIAELSKVDHVDKALITQLDVVTKAISRLLDQLEAQEETSRSLAAVTENEFTAFLREMDERIRVLSDARFAALADRFASTLCAGCAARLRDGQASAAATASNGAVADVVVDGGQGVGQNQSRR